MPDDHGLSDESLREKARDKLRRGELPPEPETRVWGGPGVNKPCSLCEAPIDTHDIEYEIELLEPRDSKAYRFHRRCLAAWQIERERA